MGNEYFLLTADHRVEPVGNAELFAAWRMSDEGRRMCRVALTDTALCTVSTVFLGVNHAFIEGDVVLFETMIIGGGRHDGYQDRCRTYAEALLMHSAAVALSKRT